MSRSPLPGKNEQSREQKVAEEYVNFIVREATPKAISENEVREETNRDETLQVVIKLIESGKWHEVENFKHSEIDYKTLQSFKAVQEELSIGTTDVGTVIMRDTKLVMPSSLQQQTLDLAHEGHQGITKTKALLRSKVWFPNIDRMIEEKVSIVCLC